MKLFKTNSGGEKMEPIKSFSNLISVKSASFFIICVWIAFALGCSAEGKINGGTVNLPGADPALEWVAPEAVGWSSAELQDAHEFAIQSGCQAVMALYDGKVFFSRGIFIRITGSIR